MRRSSWGRSKREKAARRRRRGPPPSPRLRVVRTASGRECPPSVCSGSRSGNQAESTREEGRRAQGGERRRAQGGGRRRAQGGLPLPPLPPGLPLPLLPPGLPLPLLPPSTDSLEGPAAGGTTSEGGVDVRRRHEGFSHAATKGTRPTQSTKVRHTPRRSVPRYVSPFVGARYPVQSGQVGAGWSAHRLYVYVARWDLSAQSGGASNLPSPWERPGVGSKDILLFLL